MVLFEIMLWNYIIKCVYYIVLIVNFLYFWLVENNLRCVIKVRKCNMFNWFFFDL